MEVKLENTKYLAAAAAFFLLSFAARERHPFSSSLAFLFGLGLVAAYFYQHSKGHVEDDKTKEFGAMVSLNAALAGLVALTAVGVIGYLTRGGLPPAPLIAMLLVLFSAAVWAFHAFFSPEKEEGNKEGKEEGNEEKDGREEKEGKEGEGTPGEGARVRRA